MSELERSGLHTPQQRPEQEPQPYTNPPQDDGDSNEFLDQLAGRNVDETAYIDVSDVESLDDVTMMDVYEGDTDANQEHQEGDVESFDMLVERELRAGETGDVMEAIEEGKTYVPPIDPPVVPDRDNPESVQVAAGFSVDADDPDAAQGLDRDDTDRFIEGDDDMTTMVRRALRADSSTTHLADRLAIATINGAVILRGTVDDLDDTDNIVAVISELPGVQSIRDETTVPGL